MSSYQHVDYWETTDASCAHCATKSDKAGRIVHDATCIISVNADRRFNLRINLQRYRTEEGCQTALVIETARKWMQVLIVDAGRLRIIRAPVSDQRYMTPLQTNERKAIASLRRLARKPGTSSKIRAAVSHITTSV